MSNTIALASPIKALDPNSGKPIEIVGIDTSPACPRLIIIERGPSGICARCIDYADELPQ